MKNDKKYNNLTKSLSLLKSVKADVSFKNKMVGIIKYSLYDDKSNERNCIFGYSFKFSLALLIIFFLSCGGVVAASANVKPGSFLYPVKQFVINAKISFTDEPSEKILLNLEKTDDQIEIIKNSLEKGDESNLQKSVDDYSDTVNNLIEESNKFNAAGIDTVNHIKETLQNQEKTLEQAKTTASEDLSPLINDAIDSSLKAQEEVNQSSESTENENKEVDSPEYQQGSTQNNIPQENNSSLNIATPN